MDGKVFHLLLFWLGLIAIGLLPITILLIVLLVEALDFVLNVYLVVVQRCIDCKVAREMPKSREVLLTIYKQDVGSA